MPVLTFAIEIARAAGAVLFRRFEGALAIETKSSARDLVTDADKSAEALIVEAIRGRFPGDGILAEESGVAAEGVATWVIDPLDGTTNFAHGVPHFCVSIGLWGPEGARLGVIHDPVRGETFFAERGDGAWLESPRGPNRRLRVGALAELAPALVATGFSYRRASTGVDNLAEFAAVLPRVQCIRRAGSAALDLAYVAAGRLDAYWEHHLSPWDTAAGALLVEEAGGAVERIGGGASWNPWAATVLAGGPGLVGTLRPILIDAARSRGQDLEYLSR